MCFQMEGNEGVSGKLQFNDRIKNCLVFLVVVNRIFEIFFYQKFLMYNRVYLGFIM